jgi:hypothetical protein
MYTLKDKDKAGPAVQPDRANAQQDANACFKPKASNQRQTDFRLPAQKAQRLADPHTPATLIYQILRILLKETWSKFSPPSYCSATKSAHRA